MLLYMHQNYTTHQTCHMNICLYLKYMHGMNEEFSCSLSSFHKDLFLKYLPPSIWAADLPPDLALPDLNIYTLDDCWVEKTWHH